VVFFFTGDAIFLIAPLDLEGPLCERLDLILPRLLIFNLANL